MTKEIPVTRVIYQPVTLLDTVYVKVPENIHDFDIVMDRPLKFLGSNVLLTYYDPKTSRWQQDLYEMPERDFKMVIKTFQKVFPHTTLWLTDSDAILVGTEKELRIDYKALETKFHEGNVEKDMRMMYIDSVFQFLTFYMMGDEGLAEYAADARLNTDDHPILEFSSPTGLHLETVDENLEAIRQNIKPVLPFLYNLGDEEETSRITQKLTQYFEEKKSILEEQISDVRNQQ